MIQIELKIRLNTNKCNLITVIHKLRNTHTVFFFRQMKIIQYGWVAMAVK